MAKAKCKNCGDPTHFGNAVAERERLGWCPACFKHYRPPNADGSVRPIVSCKRCGRDTSGEYCSQCGGTAGNPFASREQIGRSALSTRTIGGSPTSSDSD
jgi:hypothetical protein